MCEFSTMAEAEGSFCTAAASFASYVSIMSKTGVLVSRHGPMLANALFLPPGEAPCIECTVLLPMLSCLPVSAVSHSFRLASQVTACSSGDHCLI